MIDVCRIVGLKQLRDFGTEARTKRLQQRTDAACLVTNDLRSPFFVPPLGATRFLDTLESMAERTVAKIVQQGGYRCDVSARFLKCLAISFHFAANDLHQGACGVKHTD